MNKMSTAKKITAFLLAMVILVSGFSITVGKMVCLKSGKTLFSFSVVEDCCTKAKKANKNCCKEEQQNSPSGFNFEKSDCCDVSNSTLQLTDFHASQKNLVPEAGQLILPFTYTFTEPESQPFLVSFRSSDLPAALFGRQLLSFISILTI